MSEELKPCPVCFGTDIHSDRWGPEFSISSIWCNDCGCGVDDSVACLRYDEHIVDRWNTRSVLTSHPGEDGVEREPLTGIEAMLANVSPDPLKAALEHFFAIAGDRLRRAERDGLPSVVVPTDRLSALHKAFAPVAQTPSQEPSQ